MNKNILFEKKENITKLAKMLHIYYYFLLAFFSHNLIRLSRTAAFIALEKSHHDHEPEVFYKNHMITKLNIFSPVSFYDSPIRPSREYLKRRYEFAVEKMRKENELRLAQEKRDKIYREHLAQRATQTSFHRDFHTFRY